MTMPRKPRKWNPAWKDNTRRKRTQIRRQQLDQIAQRLGFDSWRRLETAVLHGEVKIAKTPSQ